MRCQARRSHCAPALWFGWWYELELRARNLFRSLDTNPLIPLVLESLFIFSPLSVILSPIFTLDSLKYITYLPIKMTTKAEDESQRVVLSRAHDRTFDSIRLTATVDHFSFWIACIHHYYANTLTSTSRRAVPAAYTASRRLVAALRLVVPHVSTC